MGWFKKQINYIKSQRPESKKRIVAFTSIILTFLFAFALYGGLFLGGAINNSFDEEQAVPTQEITSPFKSIAGAWNNVIEYVQGVASSIGTFSDWAPWMQGNKAGESALGDDENSQPIGPLMHPAVRN